MGGIDVHLRYFDTARSSLSGDLSTRLKQGDIDFVVTTRNRNSSNELLAAIKNTDVALVTTTNLPFSGQPGTALTAKTFVQKFKQRFSYEPSRFAAQGYQLARRIDAVVRPLDSVANKSILRQRLKNNSAHGLEW
ncbi:MAG: hypothetical protein COB67_08565 [SAR324 cluster bacterium]|uniref:Uncharacterized protein n=1 Tax=SAR324 cluster bacterium TaxID=2024889 RepID=A0A2A4T193_9DELT|nr:MAG: hypothetical protein COB67_08565 [SAR324 cluster bacterium]